MLQFEELRLRLEGRKKELDDLKQAIGYEGLRRKLDELEQQTTAPGFWDDPEKSQKNQQESGRIRGKLEEYDQLVSDIASRLGSADDQLYVLLQSIEGNIPKLPDNY